MEFPEDLNIDDSGIVYLIRYKISRLIEYGVRAFELNMVNTSYSLIVTVRSCLVFFTQDYLLDLPDCKMEYDPFNYFGFYDLPLIASTWPKTLEKQDNRDISNISKIKSSLFNLLD